MGFTAEDRQLQLVCGS